MAGAKPGVHVLQLKPVNVPKSLQEGEKFVKWEEDSPIGTPCTLRVDPYGFFLHWTYFTDQHETDILDISTISDTRTNRSAKLPKDSKLKEQVNIGSHDIPLEQKTMTIVNGSNFVELSFTNFVHQKPETVKFWSEELSKLAYNLLAQNASPFTHLKKTYTRLCILKDKNGKIPVKQIVKVFARQGEDKRRVEQSLISCNLTNAKTDSISEEDFSWDKFVAFYNKLTARIEVEKIFCELTNQPFSNEATSGPPRPMTSDQLVTFLNQHQRDPRLNEILYPYTDASRAAEVIAQYESNESYVSKGVLGIEGFLNYLLSDDNTVISWEKLDLHADMNQPLNHYFINSSHNTYLIGHQLTGKSSVEMYRQCLLAGCRCLELDFWNGRTEEPVIVHGFTLVPEISAREVLEAIGECAFKTSDWPVILSFENHCNPRQQAKIAQYCRDFFRERLLDVPLEGYPLEPNHLLPPVSVLRRRIIIKNKKKHRTHHKKPAQAVGSGDSQFHVDLSREGARPTTGEATGNGVIPRPILEKEGSRESYPEEVDVANGEIPDGGGEEEISSSSEEDDDGSTSPEDRRSSQRRDTAAVEEEAGAEISALVNYVQPVHFTSFEVAEKRAKTYEMSSFVETQGLNLLKLQPTEFVNYNKRQLSRVYPKGTRVDSSNFLPHQFWNAGCQFVALNYQTLDLPMQLNLGIFEYNSRSGYLLKPEFMRRPDRRFDPFAESTVDGIIAGTLSVKIISGQFLSDKKASCYVEVEMYGLPTDTVRKKFRTKTIPNNGINPVWDEDTFTFKKVVLPDLATIRLVAYDESSKSMLGHRVLPLVGLIPGYKHIVLRNEKSQPLSLAMLFVHIKVGDYVPDGLSDFAEALANPIKYQNEIEKRSHQLEVFEDDNDKTLMLEGVSDSNGVAGVPSVTQTTRSSLQPETREQQSISLVVKKSDSVPIPAKPNASPPSGRQNSIIRKPTISGKVSDDRSAAVDIPPLTLEITEIKAEDLDKLWENKGLKERKKKIEKEIKELETKLEKKRQTLLQDQEKSKKKLVKKFSLKSPSESYKKKRSDFGTSEEHEGRLEDLQQVLRSSLIKLHQEQLQAEKRIHEENHEPLYNMLEKILKASQQTQMKDLQSLHNVSVEELKKRQQEDQREKMKLLSKTSSDKQELERKRREMSQDLVTKGTQERQRLIEIFEKKKLDLEKQHESIRQKYNEEKIKALQDIQKSYEEKMHKIFEERIENL